MFYHGSSKFCLGIAVLLVAAFMAAPLAASQNPVESIEEWALGSDAADKIYKHLQVDGKIAAAYKVESVSAESNSCVVCLKHRKDKFSEFCLVMKHTSKAKQGEDKLPQFSVTADRKLSSKPMKAAYNDMIERISELPSDLWTPCTKPYDSSVDTLQNLISIYDDLAAWDGEAASDIASRFSQHLSGQMADKPELKPAIALFRALFMNNKGTSENLYAHIDESLKLDFDAAVQMRLMWEKARAKSGEGKHLEAVKIYENIDPIELPELLRKRYALDFIFASLKAQGIEQTVSALEGKKVENWLKKDQQQQQGQICVASDVVKQVIGEIGFDTGMVIGRSFLKKFPDCLELSLVLVDSLFNKGLSEETLALADETLKRFPDNNELLTRKAILYRQMKQQDKALSLLEKLYRSEPEANRRLLSIWSATAREKSDYSREFEQLKLAYEKDPGDVFAAFGYGVLMFYDGEYEQVIEIMNDLRQKMPDSERVYIYGGMSRYHIGDTKGAKEWLEAFDTSMRGDNYDYDLHYCLSIVYYDDDPQKSVREMERYLSRPIVARSDSLDKKEWSVKVLEKMRRGERIWHFHWVPAYKMHYFKLALTGISVFFLVLGGFFIRKYLRKKISRK